MKIQVLKRLLEKNDATAGDIRTRLGEHGITMFNLMGSPGCGKTTLLEHTLPALQPGLRCAVLEGDLATTRDAERIAELGVPVIQLLTEGGCHLEAGLLDPALDRMDLGELDCIFVENVGNLVCPANFDLGEHARVAVLSVAEGDDKPQKYPFMFQRCDVVVISKCDLLSACRFDLRGALQTIRGLNEKAPILQVSAPLKQGLEPWIEWIAARIADTTGRDSAVSP